MTGSVYTDDNYCEWQSRLMRYFVLKFASRPDLFEPLFGDRRDAFLRKRGDKLTERQLEARNELTKRNRARALAASISSAPHVPTLTEILQ